MSALREQRATGDGLTPSLYSWADPSLEHHQQHAPLGPRGLRAFASASSAADKIYIQQTFV